MAGRKRRKLKQSTKTITQDERAVIEKKKEIDEQQTWSDLPVDLLEQIISQLTLKENICASAVCKRWLSAALSVRVVNKPPWLMFIPKVGDLFEFYDPSQRKTYFLELPELHGTLVCYAKCGWLLLYKPRTERVLFFNPYTRESIKLPKFELTCEVFAFSSEPTSPGCIVFTVRHFTQTIVTISTCHPGATEWTAVHYPNPLPFYGSMWNKLVFSNGLFYCLSLTGRLGVYSPQEHTWNICDVLPIRCPEIFFKNGWKRKFIAEHKGDIFVIYACYDVNPKVYKLDQTKKVWVEVKTLGGLMLFASSLSSHARTDLLGLMRNCVYFPKVRFYGKRCISYSLDDCRYYPRKQCNDWGEQDPFDSVWIEPPEDLSIFV